MDIRSQLSHLFRGVSLTALLAIGAAAQDQEIVAQRAMVTRAELEATLALIDKEVNSPGYSQALREARRSEADAIRARLKTGDIQVGDKIHMVVVGSAANSHDYPVSQMRTISLSGGAEISVAGPLRSELSSYLTTQLKQYFEDPTVIATASIRLTLSGSLGHTGYFYVPATDLLQAVLMDPGGGPGRSHLASKDQIKRNDKVVVDGPEFAAALHDGKTLDQLNVQAGDEIIIGDKPTGNIFSKTLTILGALGSAAAGYYFLRQIL